jgi:hypothetical protein
VSKREARSEKRASCFVSMSPGALFPPHPDLCGALATLPQQGVYGDVRRLKRAELDNVRKGSKRKRKKRKGKRTYSSVVHH